MLVGFSSAAVPSSARTGVFSIYVSTYMYTYAYVHVHVHVHVYVYMYMTTCICVHVYVYVYVHVYVYVSAPKGSRERPNRAEVARQTPEAVPDPRSRTRGFWQEQGAFTDRTQSVYLYIHIYTYECMSVICVYI